MSTKIIVTDTTANPAPLGLFGFGMTTILLNLHNAGFFEMNAVILSMGLLYGGIAQIIAGIMEAKKGNSFGLTAFTSYGFFWLSLVCIILLPKTGLSGPVSNVSMISFLVIWGLFTSLLFIVTFKISKALQWVFGSLTLLFILLVLDDATGIPSLKKIAGFEGIFCGALAIYTGIAGLLSETFGRTILPIGLVPQGNKENSFTNEYLEVAHQ